MNFQEKTQIFARLWFRFNKSKVWKCLNFRAATRKKVNGMFKRIEDYLSFIKIIIGWNWNNDNSIAYQFLCPALKHTQKSLKALSSFCVMTRAYFVTYTIGNKSFIFPYRSQSSYGKLLLKKETIFKACCSNLCSSIHLAVKKCVRCK